MQKLETYTLQYGVDQTITHQAE
ncbi:hypothetical protein Prudu_004459 [Prunus dulcis]|uniref:Uncharacterized protein n=1 Tax=Prunus dulcis TaxID=3755 RepID=A0A4Y1QVD0_PRUDU|nr:hypothetical protein Prudu_004459 [Prunus dulcis]